MPKLRLYCKFKEHKQEELYLSLPIPMRLRRDLARFRSTSHNLEVEMGRHNILFEDRLCQLCGRSNIFVVEDEFHVVFDCEAYNDIRCVYINKEVLIRANEYSFISLMKTDNADDIVNFANFILCLFKVRKQLYRTLQP